MEAKGARVLTKNEGRVLNLGGTERAIAEYVDISGSKAMAVLAETR